MAFSRATLALHRFLLLPLWGNYFIKPSLLSQYVLRHRVTITGGETCLKNVYVEWALYCVFLL